MRCAAMATNTKANMARPSETRSPMSAFTNVDAMEESCVVPAKSATLNTTSSMAGSASEEIIISREEPMPPKAVPTSMPASASAKRAVASSATIAMRSAEEENMRLVA